jgi:hypothetical protein
MPAKHLWLRAGGGYLVVQLAVADRGDQRVDDLWELVERRHRNGGLALLKLYSPRRMPKAYISLPAGRHHA